MLPDYKLFDFVRKKKPRAPRGSGGVAVFVHYRLFHHFDISRIRLEIEDSIILHLHIKGGNQRDLILYFTYIAPENSPIYTNSQLNGIEVLHDNVNSIIADFPNIELFLAGDFNARTANLLDYIPNDDLSYIFNDDCLDYPSDAFDINRCSKDTKLNNFGKSLLEMCCTCDIHILNGRLCQDKQGNFTCLANSGSSVVDYMIASTSLINSNIIDFRVEDVDFSDHFPLSCILEFKCCSTEKVTNYNTQKGTQTNWNKMNWKIDLKGQFVSKFADLYHEFCNKVDLENSNSLLESLPTFVELYHTAGKDMHISTRRFTPSSHAKWWDEDCSLAKKEKYLALRIFRRINSDLNRLFYISKRNRFKALCRKKKIAYSRSKKQALIQAHKSPKEFWKLLRENNSSFNDNSNNISSEEWYKYYSQLLTNRNVISDENLPGGFSFVENNFDCSILNEPINDEEIIKSVRSTKNNKSPGPDGINAEMYKETLILILPYLNKLFNAIFDSGIFPENWGKSIITPVFKKGSKNDPDNYRAISLTDSICKIFMNILATRLNHWSEENRVLDESQAGFRQKYSTVDNVFNLMALVQKYLSKKKGRFYCIFIDFEKAFDNVQHHQIWKTFERNNINGKYLQIMKSLYRSTKSCVKCNNKLTDYFICSVGTRQGCVASPKIFSLLINDLIKYLQHSCGDGVYVSDDVPSLYALMYADDVSSIADTVLRLQKQIDSISSFSKELDMKINIEKSKIIVFRNGGPLRRSEKWYLDGKQVEVVPFYKYLGVYFTPKLSWTLTVDKLCLQASKASNTILRYQQKFGRLPPKDMFKIFDSMVKPILCFASDIWGYKYNTRIESAHAKFCKKYCYLPEKCTDNFALNECGRLPLCISYMSNCIKFWIRIIHLEPHRYPKQCYNLLLQLDFSGRETWASHIKNLLFTYGFGYAWIFQDVGDESQFLKTFKQRLIDCFSQKMHSDIVSSPKGQHFQHFSSLLNVEQYLSLDLSYKLRKTLSNFRCSCHSLMIEKGRQLGIDRDFRYCPLCFTENILVIEDEVHFFNDCPTYNNLRAIYFKQSWLTNKTTATFYSILSTNKTDEIIRLANFLFQAFKYRNDLNENTFQ